MGGNGEGSAGSDMRGLLGSLEARVMEDLWANEPSAVGDVLARLNASTRRQLAYNTVMTVMAKLADKGYLRRRREGRAYVYEPAESREGFLRSRATEAAQDLLEYFDEVAVAGFIDSVRQRPELLVELERLMNQSDRDDDDPQQA